MRRVPLVAWLALAFLVAVLAPNREHVLALLGDARLPRVMSGPGGPAPAGSSFTARVSVVDGDTLAMGGERLRLHGMDAPESRQPCQRNGRSYDCGREATETLAAIIGRGVVACRQLDTDQYGRRIVRCHTEQGADIGADMVRRGWAIAFRRYSLDYLAQEAEARAARRGLWAGSFDEPAEWRRRTR
jgi:endonuclease YncB( thermonuclease family)